MSGKKDKEKAIPVPSVGPDPVPIGRPSLYDDAHCETVERLGAQGWSKAEMCAYFNIHRNTIDGWADSHPVFRESLNRARELAQAWWERAGREGMYAGKDFNAAVWKKTVESRFREDYTERRVTEVVNNEDLGTAFKRRFDITLLEPEQRDQLRYLLTLCLREEKDDRGGSGGKLSGPV